MTFFPVPRAAVLLALLTLSACATKPVTLYGWDGYQQQLYQYLQTDGSRSPEQQILSMQESAQKISARGQRLPPGYHAHLGLLYASAGKEELAIGQLETEKALFPESAG